MIVVVTGGSASGKSAWAEHKLLACGENCRRFYIATMKPGDAEQQEKIIRHQKLRSQKRFTTIECYTDLAGLRLPPPKPGEPLAVLVECMSNLAANEMFDIGGTVPEILSRIMAGINRLQTMADDIVIVTNEVFSDGGRYAEATQHYLKLLGMVNQELGRQARQVIEVVYGIPIRLKDGRESQGG